MKDSHQNLRDYGFISNQNNLNLHKNTAKK